MEIGHKDFLREGPAGVGGSWWQNFLHGKPTELPPTAHGAVPDQAYHPTSFNKGKTTFSQPTYNSEFPTTWADKDTSDMAPGPPGISKAILEKAQQNFIAGDLADNTRLGGKFSPNGLDKSVTDTQNNVSDMRRSRAMIGLGGTMAPSFGGGNF